MYQTTLTFETGPREFKNITKSISKEIKSHLPERGLCHLFIQHTSASLLVAENSDPKVRRDLEKYLSRLVKDGDPLFTHTAEGADDMSAHIRTILTETSLMIPINNYSLALGTWQGIFLWEHRMSSHERKVIISIL